MSEQPVRKSDLIEGAPIDEFSKELDRGIAKLEEWDKKLISVAETMNKTVKDANTNTLKGINAINEAEKRSKKVLQEKKITEQDLQKRQEQSVKLRNARIKAMDDFEKKLQREAKAEKKAAETAKKAAEKKRLEEIKLQQAREKAFDKYEAGLRKSEANEKKAAETARKLKRTNLDNANAYKILTKRVNTAQARFKRLAVQYGETDKRTIRARKNFERLDNQLRKVNNNARDGRRDVGRYGLATEKMGKSVRKVTGLLAQFGLAMGGAAIARNAFNVIKDFQQAQANLASVLGVNVDKMKALTEQAKELGSTTRFTASQVSELQVELAKLGFTQQQIEAMTPATLALAEATGSELAEAASVAGGTLNAFGFEAKNTQQIVDTMAKAFSTSSLDMEKFKVGMATVAPVAKNAGFSIEQTTAMLGVLTDNNLQASKAATGMKNIFLELSKQGITYEDALSQIANSTDKNATAIKLFKKEGATAAIILAEQNEAVQKQTKLLNDNTKASLEGKSAAAEMANTQRNTLGGAIDLLKSAWEGLILSMDEAGGVGETLRKGIVFLADNLGTIIKLIGQLVKAFIAWKVAIAALKLQENASNFKKFGKAAEDAADGLSDGAKSAKGFGRALKGMALAAAISVLLELALAFWDVASNAKNAREAAARFRKQEADADKIASKRIEERSAALDKLIAKQQRLLDEGKITTEEFLAEKERLIKANEELIRSDIRTVNSRKAGLKEDLKTLEFILQRGKANIGLNKEQAKLAESFGIDVKVIDGVRTLTSGIGQVNKAIAQQEAQIAGANVKLTQYNNELSESTEESKDAKSAIKAFSKSTLDATESGKKLNTTLAEQNRLLSKQTELLQELDQLDFSRRVSEVQARIDEGVANLLSIGEIKKMVDEKNAILRAAAKSRRDFEIAQIKETSRLESEEELKRINDNKDKLLAQKGLTTAQKEEIEKQYQDQLKKFEMDELQRAADLELEIKLIKGLSKDELIALKKAEAEELNAINDELIRGNEELEKSEKDAADARKEALLEFIRIEQAITAALSDQIDKRIALKQEEKDEAKKTQDFFQQLAANGNIEANQSIKEQIEFQKEAQREIDRLERQKANLQLISAGLSTFSQQIEGGAKPGEALATTILSTQALTSFLAGLKFFEKGTMNAPEGMAVVDEKGAEMITDKNGNIKSLGTESGARLTHLESGDKVYTAAQTASKMAALNNVDNAHQMAGKTDSAGNSFDLLAMQKGISRAFDQSIKKMPHSSTNWVGIAQGMGKVVEEKVRGNDVERSNQYFS